MESGWALSRPCALYARLSFARPPEAVVLENKIPEAPKSWSITNSTKNLVFGQFEHYTKQVTLLILQSEAMW